MASDTQHSGLPRFPNELLLSFVDELGRDYLRNVESWECALESKRALVNCALTCRAFRDQAYRYSHGSTECKWVDRIPALLRAIVDGGTPTYIHTLTLSFGQYASPWWGFTKHLQAESEALMARFFSGLPFLQDFKLEGSDMVWTDVFVGMRTTVVQLFSSGRLERLQLSGMVIPSSLFDCLSPSIRCFGIGDVYVNDEDSDDAVSSDPIYHPPWLPSDSLQTLKIAGISSAVDFIVGRQKSGATGSFNISALEQVVIEGYDNDEARAVRSLLNLGLSSLKHFQCTHSHVAFNDYWFSDSALTMDLLCGPFESLSVIAHFDIGFPIAPFPKKLCDLLDGVTKASQLRRIRIKVIPAAGSSENLNHDDVLQKPKWGELGEALSRPEFDKLEFVQLDLVPIRKMLWRGMDFQELRRSIREQALPRLASFLNLTIMI